MSMNITVYPARTEKRTEHEWAYGHDCYRVIVDYRETPVLNVVCDSSDIARMVALGIEFATEMAPGIDVAINAYKANNDASDS